MEENMKKISRGMGIRMGLVMSFFLSLTGTLTSGHFTFPGFIISFIVSAIVSILIGFFIPIAKVTVTASEKLGLKRGSLTEKLFMSLISNIIYTPLMTFIMICLAYRIVMIQSGGRAPVSIMGMYLPSLVICFVVGYVLIFIFTPIFMGQLMKKYGPQAKGAPNEHHPGSN